MKKNEIFKKLIFAVSGISMIILFTFCGNDEDIQDGNDSLTDIENVKKSREELIVLRDTMRFSNPDSITDFEYKHTPEIAIGDTNEDGLTTVNIKIGSNGIVHPSEEGHWIDYLAVHLDGTQVERREAENGPGSNEASFILDLTNVKEITVEAGCNLHGIWFNTMSLIEE